MYASDQTILLVLFLVAWWIAASSAVASAAKKRSRSGTAWFWLSIVLGPVFAILLLIAYPREQ